MDILTQFLLIEIRLNWLAMAKNILRTTWRDTTWQHVTLIGRKTLPGYNRRVCVVGTVEPTLHSWVLQSVVDIIVCGLALTTIGPFPSLGPCVVLNEVQKVLTLTRSMAYLALLRF